MSTLYSASMHLPGSLSQEQISSLELVFSELLDSAASSHHRIDDADWKIEALFDGEPDVDMMNALLAQQFDALGLAPVLVSVEVLADRDWLAANRAAFPPLSIGRFWIYGSHVKTPPPAGHFPLLIEAAQAFGSGTHPTTEGCLRAAQMIAETQSHRPRMILDMGCGSAILGMAGHKLWPSSMVIAADNDPVAVKVAALNGRLNGIAPAQMRTIVSAGFAGRQVRQSGPYDFIFANILAGPLRRMARSLMPHLADSGWLVLSGILNEQALSVERAYAAQGARCWGMISIGDWTTIIMRPAGFGTMPALWQGRPSQ